MMSAMQLSHSPWAFVLLISCMSLECLASSSAPPFLSIPLIPHRVQESRRRLEKAWLMDEHGNGQNVTQHYLRFRDRRQLGAQTVGALYQGYGTHYVDLWCGTPAQRQTVIVDTGSAVTAFPCSDCTDCGKKFHIDNVFHEKKSPSFSLLDCDECMRGHCSSKADGRCIIGMSYQEGSSWSAMESKDFCYVGGPHGEPLVPVADAIEITEPNEDIDMDPNRAVEYGFDLTFGCQTRLTGLFKTQLADGIMGMDNARESFWSQMYDANKMPSRMFSLCFSRQPVASKSGTEAGAMTLGGFDTRLHKTDLVYASYTASNSFFAVHVRKIYLREGDSVDDPKITQLKINEATLNSGSVIVDSGTTDTYFTRQLAGPFKKAWKEFTGKTYSNDPISLTTEELLALPTILFQLSGVTDLNKMVSFDDPNSITGLTGDLDQDNPMDVILAMPPSHYMEFDDEIDMYVPRFYVEELRGSVLGANAMMGHDMVFDIDHNRLGIAESDCAYAAAVEAAGYLWELPLDIDTDVEDDDEQTGKEEEDELAAIVASDFKDDSSDVSGGLCEGSMCRGSLFGSSLLVLIALILRRRATSETDQLEDIVQGLELQESDMGDNFECYEDEPIASTDDSSEGNL